MAMLPTLALPPDPAVPRQHVAAGDIVLWTRPRSKIGRQKRGCDGLALPGGHSAAADVVETPSRGPGAGETSSSPGYWQSLQASPEPPREHGDGHPAPRQHPEGSQPQSLPRSGHLWVFKAAGTGVWAARPPPRHHHGKDKPAQVLWGPGAHPNRERTCFPTKAHSVRREGTKDRVAF